MPSGKVHGAVTLAAAGLTYIWGYTSGETLPLAAAAAVGCATGLILTPDLDEPGTRADYLVKDRLGFFPAVVWGLLWYPYSALIPHRYWLSHGLIISTILRLIYISIPIIIFRIRIHPSPILARMIIGLLISDNLHIGADYLVSGIKKIWRT